MSNSLAILRKNASKELAELAENHMKDDLQQSDRDVLNSAAQKFSTYTTIGSLVGLGLGAFLAVRVRRIRADTFKAFRAMERPTHVLFADGRTGRLALYFNLLDMLSHLFTEALPDLTPMLKPSPAGDVAAYVLFSFGGLFIGGETGLLAASRSARKLIEKDRESKERIERAFRRFRVDVPKREIANLEKGEKNSAPIDLFESRI
jgi:hypothetical protein